jgi:hypothetical protein
MSAAPRYWGAVLEAGKKGIWSCSNQGHGEWIMAKLPSSKRSRTPLPNNEVAIDAAGAKLNGSDLGGDNTEVVFNGDTN